MVYVPMRKIILTVALCLSACGPVLAQNNVQAMRFLTVNALMQYGQKLYDRGDFNEASAVFNHVLVYDSHQAQALQYLKEMGRSFTPGMPPAQRNMVAQYPDEQIVNTVDVLSTDSLKKAIEAKKRVIEKLRSQIRQMRENMASPPGEVINTRM